MLAEIFGWLVRRTFILRLVQRENETQVYQLLASVRRRSFERVEPQLRQALDSFKVLGEAP